MMSRRERGNAGQPDHRRRHRFGVFLRDAESDENAIDTAVNDVRDLIAKIDPNNPTRGLLISLVDKADPTIEDLRERLAEWFDAGMDRVAGWYKRQVKYCLIGVAAVVTVAVNADSIRMVEQLWQDDALRAAIASAAEQAATKGDLAAVDERTALRAFPIGYPDSFPGISFRMIVGWAPHHLGDQPWRAVLVRPPEQDFASAGVRHPGSRSRQEQDVTSPMVSGGVFYQPNSEYGVPARDSAMASRT